MEKNNNSPVVNKNNIPDYLLWLIDSPLFIDDKQVDNFYDAVARPVHKEGTTIIEITEENASKLSQKFGLEAKLEPGKLASLLNPVFSIIKPSIAVNAEGGLEQSKNKNQTYKTEYSPINTPQRQLEQLVLFYLLNYEDRLFSVNNLNNSDWREQENISKVPRELVFIDLPSLREASDKKIPQTKIIPTAMEFEDGKVELIYNKLKGKDGSALPEYPEDAYSLAELLEKRKIYWKWFDQNFSATQSMIEVEKAATRKIHWIDYRLPVSNDGDTLHLHICPRGNYDTGVFAYNLIKRGYKHGLRLVGTIKSEPDMNVLAIYEK